MPGGLRYDVLLLEPFAKHLRRRFADLGAAVAFGAEAACSPDTAMELLYRDVFGEADGDFDDNESKSATGAGADDGGASAAGDSWERRGGGGSRGPFRYLNSGSIMGLASELHAAVEDVVRDLTSHGANLRAALGPGEELLGGAGSITGPQASV